MPPGNDVVVTVKPVAIVICRAAVAVWPAESVTRRVKLEAPAAVGVPEITPSAASVRPAGNVPVAIDQVYGAAPPVADKLAA